MKRTTYEVNFYVVGLYVFHKFCKQGNSILRNIIEIFEKVKMRGTCFPVNNRLGSFAD